MSLCVGNMPPCVGIMPHVSEICPVCRKYAPVHWKNARKNVRNMPLCVGNMLCVSEACPVCLKYAPACWKHALPVRNMSCVLEICPLVLETCPVCQKHAPCVRNMPPCIRNMPLESETCPCVKNIENWFAHQEPGVLRLLFGSLEDSWRWLEVQMDVIWTIWKYLLNKSIQILNISQSRTRGPPSLQWFWRGQMMMTWSLNGQFLDYLRDFK